MKAVLKFPQRFRCAIRHLPVHMTPQILNRIKFRSVGRKSLCQNTGMFPKERLHSLALVNGSTIPKQSNGSSNMPQEVLQEGGNVLIIKVPWAETQVKPRPCSLRRSADSPESGDTILPVKVIQYRRLSPRRPG